MNFLETNLVSFYLSNRISSRR